VVRVHEYGGFVGKVVEYLSSQVLVEKNDGTQWPVFPDNCEEAKDDRTVLD